MCPTHWTCGAAPLLRDTALLKPWWVSKRINKQKHRFAEQLPKGNLLLNHCTKSGLEYQSVLFFPFHSLCHTHYCFLKSMSDNQQLKLNFTGKSQLSSGRAPPPTPLGLFWLADHYGEGGSCSQRHI